MHMIPQLCRLSLAGTLCVGCIAKITLLGTSVQHCTTSLAAQVMEASPESRQLHEQLESLQEQCSCWSLDADRQLLSALQNMSSGLLASLQRCRGEVESVAREAEAAAVSVAAATSHFRLLSHRRFIQQSTASVHNSLPRLEQPELAAIAAAPSADYSEEVVHPLYCEALAAAATALAAPPPAAPPRPMPYLFGSPEYLQDPHGGLGPLIPGWQPPAPIGANLVSADDAALAGGPEGLADPSVEGGGGKDARIDAGEDLGGGGGEDSRALPDFQSMLEAALRGDLGGDPSEGLDEGYDQGFSKGLITSRAPPPRAERSSAGSWSMGGTPPAREEDAHAAAAHPDEGPHPGPSPFGAAQNAHGPDPLPASASAGGRQGAQGAEPGPARASTAYRDSEARPGADAPEELVFGASEDGSSWSGAEPRGPAGRGLGVREGSLRGGLFDDEEALDLEDLRGEDLGGGDLAEGPPGAQLEGLGSGALQALGSSSLNLDDAELLASLRALTGSRAS